MVSDQVLLISILFKFVAMFIGVCGNIAVIILTRTSKFWSKEKIESSYLVGNLALADLLMCLTLYPAWIVVFILILLDVQSDQLMFCKFSRSFTCSLQFALVASLLAITVDRYIFILKPLKYPLIVTRKKVFASILAIWMTAFYVFGFKYTFMKTIDTGWRGLCILSILEGYYFSIFTIFVPTFLIIILNFLILLVARRQRKRILAGTIQAANSKTTVDHRRYRMRIVLRFFVGLGQAKTFSIVVAVLLLCVVVPTLLGTILYFFSSNSVWSTWDLIFYYEFYGINSVVNAFIYGMRHVKYRKAFAKILFKFFSCVKLSS